jgi:hypothetical protein
MGVIKNKKRGVLHHFFEGAPALNHLNKTIHELCSRCSVNDIMIKGNCQVQMFPGDNLTTCLYDFVTDASNGYKDGSAAMRYKPDRLLAEHTNRSNGNLTIFFSHKDVLVCNPDKGPQEKSGDQTEPGLSLETPQLITLHFFGCPDLIMYLPVGFFLSPFDTDRFRYLFPGYLPFDQYADDDIVQLDKPPAFNKGVKLRELLHHLSQAGDDIGSQGEFLSGLFQVLHHQASWFRDVHLSEAVDGIPLSCDRC